MPYITRKVKTTKVPFQRAPEQLCTKRIIPLTGDIFQDTIWSESIHWSTNFFNVSNIFLNRSKNSLCIEHGCSKPVLWHKNIPLYKDKSCSYRKEKQEQKDNSNMAILQLLEHYSSSYFCFLKGQFWTWRKACVSALPVPHSPVLGSCWFLFKPL